MKAVHTWTSERASLWLGRAYRNNCTDRNHNNQGSRDASLVGFPYQRGQGMQTTVYKVVRNVGGVRISAVQGPITLAYRIGEPTEACAALPEAGPLAFETYESARAFAKVEAKLAYLFNKPSVFEVYEAVAEGARPVTRLSRGMTAADRSRFWEKPDEFASVPSMKLPVSVMDAPKGSVVTSCLTLVRKVWDSESGDA